MILTCSIHLILVNTDIGFPSLLHSHASLIKSNSNKASPHLPLSHNYPIHTLWKHWIFLSSCPSGLASDKANVSIQLLRPTVPRVRKVGQEALKACMLKRRLGLGSPLSLTLASLRNNQPILSSRCSCVLSKCTLALGIAYLCDLVWISGVLGGLDIHSCWWASCIPVDTHERGSAGERTLHTHPCVYRLIHVYSRQG